MPPAPAAPRPPAVTQAVPLARDVVAVVLSLLGAREGQQVLDLSPSAGVGPAAAAAVGEQGSVVHAPVPAGSVQRAVLCTGGVPGEHALREIAAALGSGGGAVVLWPAGTTTALPAGSGLRVRLEVALDDAGRAVALQRT